MLQLMPYQRIYLAVDPIDFRKGMTSLIALSHYELEQDPFNGQVFAFRNRRATAVKLLVYDGTGFWLCLKRFSSGQLAWWPTSKEKAALISAGQLHIVLQQGDPCGILREAYYQPEIQPGLG